MDVTRFGPFVVPRNTNQEGNPRDRRYFDALAPRFLPKIEV